MRYESVAEAYRDLEAASARLEPIDRLAELFRETPTELLPTLLDGRRPTDLPEVVSHLTWHLPTPVRRPPRAFPRRTSSQVLRITHSRRRTGVGHRFALHP